MIRVYTVRAMTQMPNYVSVGDIPDEYFVRQSVRRSKMAVDFYLSIAMAIFAA